MSFVTIYFYHLNTLTSDQLSGQLFAILAVFFHAPNLSVCPQEAPRLILFSLITPCITCFLSYLTLKISPLTSILSKVVCLLVRVFTVKISQEFARILESYQKLTRHLPEIWQKVAIKLLKSLQKGTPGFIHGSFKVASLARLNKQMLSSLATCDALSLVNHKARGKWKVEYVKVTNKRTIKVGARGPNRQLPDYHLQGEISGP